MYAGAIREVFLAPAFLEPEPLEVQPETLANIHAVAMRPLSIINLQTISDIQLDCCGHWSAGVPATERTALIPRAYLLSARESLRLDPPRSEDEHSRQSGDFQPLGNNHRLSARAIAYDARNVSIEHVKSALER